MRATCTARYSRCWLRRRAFAVDLAHEQVQQRTSTIQTWNAGQIQFVAEVRAGTKRFAGRYFGDFPHDVHAGNRITRLISKWHTQLFHLYVTTTAHHA